MSRCIVNVSTGQFVRGADRLRTAAERHSRATSFRFWRTMPPGCPPHSVAPFAFKAHALCNASQSYPVLLWCDACMLPINDMEPLWEKIEQDGYMLMMNGWSNYTWTSAEAYQYLDITPEVNRGVEHVVAGIIGIDVRTPIGAEFLSEYFRLSQTPAFRGPLWNSNCPQHGSKPGARPCGPADVFGHRHDQTAASVIAWRLGMRLSPPPLYFSYAGGQKEETVIIADGAY